MYKIFTYIYYFFLKRIQDSFQTDTLESNIRADSWFSNVKTAMQCSLRGISYIGAVKTSHSGFPKAFLQEQLQDAPGGSQLVMKGVHSLTGNNLIAIGHKYCAKKVLFYIATPNAGSSMPGKPYEMKYSDV